MDYIYLIIAVLSVGGYTFFKFYSKKKIIDKSKTKSNQSGSNVEGDQAGRDIIK